MLTLHHLAYSRAHRVLWLLEELGIPYDLKRYDRTEEFRAPPELAEVHPLGRSPVIVEDGLVLAESSAILRHIHDRHGKGRLTPAPGTDAAAIHDEWLDFVESSAARPIMTLLMARLQGKGADAVAEARPAVKKMLDYLAQGIGDGPWIMGADLTLADIQLSYLLAMARAGGMLEAHPTVSDYLDRILAHPSCIAALGIGGPMLPDRMPGQG